MEICAEHGRGEREEFIQRRILKQVLTDDAGPRGSGTGQHTRGTKVHTGVALALAAQDTVVLRLAERAGPGATGLSLLLRSRKTF